MELQTIAHIVEAHRVGELGKEHRDDMAPRRKRARLLLHARLPREPGHEMIGNEIADLAQHGELAANWRGGVGLFFHTGFIAVNSAPRQFIPFPAVGWL